MQVAAVRGAGIGRTPVDGNRSVLAGHAAVNLHMDAGEGLTVVGQASAARGLM